MGGAAIAEREAATDGIPPFQDFLDQHRTLVYRFLVAAVGQNDADDCFQETFLAALRAYPKLLNGDNLRGWILAIATRKVIDSARAKSRRPEPAEDVVELWEQRAGLRAGGEDPGATDLLGDPVWKDLLELPPKQRVALVHRVLLDRPYSELAAAMGSSVDTARANVYQALKKLREAWRSRGQDEEN